MPYNPKSQPDVLAAMRCYRAPNLVILSRSQKPPLPSNDEEPSAPKKQESTEPSEGNKTELRGRSRASSLNLAKVLSSLDWKKNGKCIHATFSYWKKWPDTKEALAAEKSGLVATLGHHCTAGIWSLEYQTERFKKYGEWVPHWHCLLWIPESEDVEAWKEWARQWWARFSGNPSEFGVHVTSGDQARGTWYLAMHAAKAAQSPPFAVGRWWGYINRSTLLDAQDLQCLGEVTDRENVWWARMFRRSLRCKVRQRGRCPQGLSWFLPRGAQCELAAWIRDQIEAEKLSRTRRDGPATE